jgi:hypothetical protein
MKKFELSCRSRRKLQVSTKFITIRVSKKVTIFKKQTDPWVIAVADATMPNRRAPAPVSIGTAVEV